jgi:mannose-6-phosphate isomerase-like protein (cupin superfamily)
LPEFKTVQLPATPDVVAPDGSDVRLLAQLAGGSMAHFTLAPGVTSRAVAHRTVDEIWFVLGGSGEMWRASAEREEIVAMNPGVALTIPLGTRFQFRTTSGEPLTAVAVTMPPWPGPDEAVAVDGRWEPTVTR